ncbi:RNA polymerase II mediator complex subunit Sin4 [Apiospora arundinis]|uniref:Mediator of RNA polymerase II transcription subunit 16 n=1 Tax=Apiospora arundinis TaxID=335852 RepID=A0ABR2J5G3_9PEZI
MASEKMPLILDNPMEGAPMQVDLGDVDDLFGDSVPLNLQTRPPTKRLLLRLDELRNRGSCQGLAWSKSGTIASIAPDGQSLDLRYIRAHPKDATWGLSEPTRCTVSTNLSGGPIVHISWAPTQTSELAVIDAAGRVMILNFSTNLNKMHPPSRRWEADPLDDLHAVVGTYWMNPMPSHRGVGNPLHAPIVRDGNNYLIETTLVHQQGPFHPNPTRSAFFCVTTNGFLKMYWAQNNNKIEETTHEMESVASADDLITHAAICADPRWKCMFVALATSSKQIQLVQAQLDWGLPTGNKGVPPGNLQLSPTLKTRHVVVSSWLQSGSNETPLDASMTQLSHIKLLPSAYDQGTKNVFPLIVLTVRSFVPPSDSPYSQEVQSIIDRWEVVFEQPQTLHPSFEQLGSRRNSVGSAPPTAPRLKRLDPIVVNKIVTGIHMIRMGTVIAFTYHDGTTEYRDRGTLAETWNSFNLDRIGSVHEAGFTQGGEPTCLQTAISPTHFSVVQLCEDGKVKWHPVQYTIADPSSMTDAQHSGVVAALTMSTAQAATTHNNIDDILAVARYFVGREKFAEHWVTEMVRLMRISIDYSEEAHHDSLVRNNLLQLCLSTLNNLGWNGEYQPRNFRGKLSMFALHLRNIVILITIASNGSIQLKNNTSPLDEPEVVDALAGCCKWSIDLLCWLADSLFNLLDDAKFLKFLESRQNFGEMTAYLLSKNDVALHMVLSSAIRGLLSAVCRRMAVLHGISQRALTYYETRNASASKDANAPPGTKTNGPPAALHLAYQKMYQYTNASLINVAEFDKLLTTLGADIRKQYGDSFAELAKRAAASAAQQPNQNQQQGPNAPKFNPGEEAVKRAQTHCELTLLLAGSPPPPFLNVVNKFFKTDLKEFRTHTDPAKLFFADYSILEVDDDPRALSARRQKGARVDLFKRVEIYRSKEGVALSSALSSSPTAGGGGGAGAGGNEQPQWRRCVRCASVMEDVPTNKPGITFVLSQQRNCSCGARFALLGKGELVG